MATLKVVAFKKDGDYGRFYTSEEYHLKDYPSITSEKSTTTLSEMRNKQINYMLSLWDDIKNGKRDDLCPIKRGFRGYCFVFMTEFDDSEFGFLTHLLDRSDVM